MSLNVDKYSDNTAPYNKCLEFTVPTELKITKDDAPPENNCIPIHYFLFKYIKVNNVETSKADNAATIM